MTAVELMPVEASSVAVPVPSVEVMEEPRRWRVWRRIAEGTGLICAVMFAVALVAIGVSATVVILAATFCVLAALLGVILAKVARR